METGELLMSLISSWKELQKVTRCKPLRKTLHFKKYIHGSSLGQNIPEFISSGKMKSLLECIPDESNKNVNINDTSAVLDELMKVILKVFDGDENEYLRTYFVEEIKRTDMINILFGYLMNCQNFKHLMKILVIFGNVYMNTILSSNHLIILVLFLVLTTNNYTANVSSHLTSSVTKLAHSTVNRDRMLLIGFAPILLLNVNFVFTSEKKILKSVLHAIPSSFSFLTSPVSLIDLTLKKEIKNCSKILQIVQGSWECMEFIGPFLLKILENDINNLKLMEDLKNIALEALETTTKIFKTEKKKIIIKQLLDKNLVHIMLNVLSTYLDQMNTQENSIPFNQIKNILTILINIAAAKEKDHLVSQMSTHSRPEVISELSKKTSSLTNHESEKKVMLEMIETLNV
jgi:hypothetical protein